MLELINQYIAPLDISAIFTAVLCSFFIGLERQYSGKPAGIRTSILICLGAYCFVSLSSALVGDFTDTSRVVGQVVTGIGFLGAGIMFNNGKVIQGITSAAVVWIIAAIGCLIGFNFFGASIGITIMTLATLIVISFLERRFNKLREGNHQE